MKKPITIGVIAVIAIVLVTSVVDYSAIGAKPIDQIHLQTSSSTNDGLIFCPNGTPLETSTGRVSFTEDIGGAKGSFEQSSDAVTVFATTFWSGSVQSNQFTFTGIGNESRELAKICNLPFPTEQGVVTVWGECGTDVTVHFESELGYSGSFTGNILCV